METFIILVDAIPVFKGNNLETAEQIQWWRTYFVDNIITTQKA